MKSTRRTKKNKKDKNDKKDKSDKKEKKHKKDKKGKKDKKDDHEKTESQAGGIEEATTGEEGTTTCDIKPKLEEFRAQHTNLAAVLDVTRTELEGMLEPFSRRCSGWVMEPSIAASPALMRSPPFRGVCGGNGEWYISGRTEFGAGHAKHYAEMTQEMANDIVINEVREAISVLEDEIDQAGGLTGGWKDFEHEMFQRIFRMYRKQPSPLLNERMAERLPGMCMDEIAAHVEWFIEFEHRQSAKRKLFARRRERIAQLEQAAFEAQEDADDQERRRREGLKRSRSLDQQRLLGQWRQAREKTEQTAEAMRLSMRQQKAQKQKERALMQKEENVKQMQELDRFRKERAAAAAREAEENAASSQRAPVTPDVRRKIKNRNSASLRKLKEETQSMLRQRSEPTLKIPKNLAYQHIESNVYATTAAFSQRVAARTGGLREPVEYEGVSAQATSLRELRMYNAWLNAASPISYEESAAEFSAQLFTIPEPPSMFEAVD